MELESIAIASSLDFEKLQVILPRDYGRGDDSKRCLEAKTGSLIARA